MYAVIKTGGKQYRVKEGDVLKIEQLSDDVGSEIKFAEVLMIGNGDDIVCGSPFVNKAVVNAQVLEHARHDKINIIKFKRRKHYMRRQGHRQYYTQVKITGISQ